MTSLKDMKMHVAGLEVLTDDVFRVFLQTTDNSQPDFLAGQYLMLRLSETGEGHAFSVASSPTPATDTLELHIQCTAENQTAQRIIDHMRQHDEVWVTLGLGKSYLDVRHIPDTPLIFIAAATGFAQMKGMIEFMNVLSHPHPLLLYWGVKKPQDFYMPTLPHRWVREGLIEYHPVISNPLHEDEWEGRFGLLFEAVLEDCHRFPDASFYISGSPNMVYATVDALVCEGFSEKVMHSDVFEYAPRLKGK